MIPLLAIIVAVVVSTDEPIIRRADRPDSAYLELGSRCHALVSIGKAGDGTLIGRQWVLTAAHVARAVSTRQPAMRTVQVNGITYAVTQTFIHPAWTEMGPHDVGLLRLATPVAGVQPIPLYRGRLEAKQVATLLGHGGNGTGAARARIEDAKARGATSRIDSVDTKWLYFSFDAPPSGTNLEGAPGPGDSGGPALILVGGKTYVAGVSSAGYDGKDGPGSYGAIDVFTRVSTHAGWIDGIMKRPISSSSSTASGRSSARGIASSGLRAF